MDCVRVLAPRVSLQKSLNPFDPISLFVKWKQQVYLTHGYIVTGKWINPSNLI